MSGVRQTFRRNLSGLQLAGNLHLYDLSAEQKKSGIGKKRTEVNIRSVRVYSDNFKVFVIGADKGFCQKAQTAGAYVFARPTTKEQWYDMPISVLKAEPNEGRLHLGVCGCGPSQALWKRRTN